MFFLSSCFKLFISLLPRFIIFSICKALTDFNETTFLRINNFIYSFIVGIEAIIHAYTFLCTILYSTCSYPSMMGASLVILFSQPVGIALHHQCLCSHVYFYDVIRLHHSFFWCDLHSRINDHIFIIRPISLSYNPFHSQVE